LPTLPQPLLNPRKLPVQSRSAASVEAILEATIQVLLQVGKEQLTTTKVAARAGVSVGTLYQYFPNKSSLLQAVLKRHFAQIIETVERVCQEQRGAPLRVMAAELITAFFQAKMRDGKTSVALYSVSSDVDGAKVALQVAGRINQAIAAMLASAPEKLVTEPALVATMLQSSMAGVSRRILESPAPQKLLPPARRELIAMACAYLEASSIPAPKDLAHTETVAMAV